MGLCPCYRPRFQSRFLNAVCVRDIAISPGIPGIAASPAPAAAATQATPILGSGHDQLREKQRRMMLVSPDTPDAQGYKLLVQLSSNYSSTRNTTVKVQCTRKTNTYL